MLPFSGNPLDRASDRRTEAGWLAAKRAEPSARIFPLWRLKPLVVGPDGLGSVELRFLAGDERAARDAGHQEVFLGLDGEAAYFARDVSALADPVAALGGRGHFADARSVVPVLPPPQVAILGQAKALLDWHARHGFCSVCGVRTESADGGYRRRCPGCGADHFPRTDPVAIMLVAEGEHCLLGQNRRFSGTAVYSALAGFIEPGETIEEAVRREVFEEVAIRVGKVRYVATQPWPFPSSLMIGCFAEARSREIAVDGREIVAARWFDRTAIRRMLAGAPSETIRLPPREAIAHHLIREWAEGTWEI